ncbi:homeobox-leucine zipper protein HOX3 [Cynara cardunculus var. scolymus]|uniref:homeobox-leucine zipper protein HOX3 n=1 Tax=Cynara cardunculus var. scolymus TaxID=59895 RepID=UPI000D625659|nr:homeobox-leucine zipper protein HOX3 [Cynara cardunculus var. scolymus]
MEKKIDDGGCVEREDRSSQVGIGDRGDGEERSVVVICWRPGSTKTKTKGWGEGIEGPWDFRAFEVSKLGLRTLGLSGLELVRTGDDKREKGNESNVVRRKFDINKVPSEEQWITTTIGGNEEESATTIGISKATNGGGGGPPMKKIRLSVDQSRLLEESFQQNYRLNPKMKQELAGKLMLKPRQVEVWFQNRRARNKLKQTEIKYEYLKRCFESLAEQNKKLHKELEELTTTRVGSSTMFSPVVASPSHHPS